MTGPIFVTGASRSGKTLMRAVLSSHSRIVVTRRTDMWPRFYLRYGDLDRPANLERCLSAMLARRHIAMLQPDVDRIRRDFNRGSHTYHRLFALLHEQYAERCGKPRWGDQTAGLERMANEIVPAYQRTRVIHMLRDPRDRLAALVERRPPGRLTLPRSTLEWIRSAVLARHNRALYPDAYCVVRYESLVGSPEHTMRGLCGFLGENYEPQMLRMKSEPRYRDQRLACGARTPLTTTYIGRHREVLDRRSAAFVRAVARSQMHALGYTGMLSSDLSSDLPDDER
jgi:hypothetical protein